MKIIYSSTKLAFLIWVITNLLIALCYFFFISIPRRELELYIFFAILICGIILSIPFFLIVTLSLKILSKWYKSPKTKLESFFVICLITQIPYSLLNAEFFGTFSFQFEISYWGKTLLHLGILSSCTCISLFLFNKQFTNLLTTNSPFMDTNQFNDVTSSKPTENQQKSNNPSLRNDMEQKKSSRILIKGLITAGLILGLLIPTAFVQNLVTERETRHQEVVKEVTKGWATDQTLTGPYLYIPYTTTVKDNENKDVTITRDLFLLPENQNVDGEVIPEIRPRSIYKVLLYRSKIKNMGNFNLQIPKDIAPESIVWKDAKLCLGITDYKGIEEKVSIQFNGARVDVAPGLPIKLTEVISTTAPASENGSENNVAKQETRESIGLSAPVTLSVLDLAKPLSFAFEIKLKGSEQLHFMPLSANSNYTIKSSWASPKFDGNNLPNTRKVSNEGFEAKWSFNNANLPFGTVVKDFNFNKQNLAFGVSLVQPADQYAKTMRSVKYAILFIGLTFALFFIIELMQHKPMHPIQYILIGMALVIFFTLLLSISEFIPFDIAYLIAAFATILLITIYAKAHFGSAKSASVFASLLSGLYAFIFVLIRLEDAALLVGSIGLFIILALIMFGSRKINWYQSSLHTES